MYRRVLRPRLYRLHNTEGEIRGQESQMLGMNGARCASKGLAVRCPCRSGMSPVLETWRVASSVLASIAFGIPLRLSHRLPDPIDSGRGDLTIGVEDDTSSPRLSGFRDGSDQVTGGRSYKVSDYVQQKMN